LRASWRELLTAGVVTLKAGPETDVHVKLGSLDIESRLVTVHDQAPLCPSLLPDIMSFQFGTRSKRTISA
jgi:hypothetical protein